MAALPEIRLTNTLTGKRERVEPPKPGEITFYTCGPTVYNYIHVGNLRGALVADLAVRAFRHLGYKVNYVRNYTDVDDKIIARAGEEKLTPAELADKYVREVEKDYAVAGLLDPDHKTRVTTHMPEIIAMIESLIARGHAYVAPDGEVLYSIDSFKTYGKLSRKNLEDLVAGHRVEVSAKKKNPLDFTLWKPAKPGEPSWPSPWTAGRPGWHIECSAMACKWLGDQIDVHHGGEDLIFPHHENEIAQSEGASGRAPFVRTWIHHAFVTLSKEKMSKSLGNIFTARQFLELYGGEVARFFLLGSHYRSPIDFSEDAIEQAITGLHRIYEAKAKASELAQKRAAVPDQRAEGLWGSFVMDCDKAKQEIRDAYAGDLNTAGALGALFTLIREFNRVLSEPRAQATPSVVLGAQALLGVIEGEIAPVIGVGRRPAAQMLQDLEAVKLKRSLAAGQDRPAADEIERLLAERVAARAAKNFARGDEIRKVLDARGVVIKDRPGGQTDWEYK